MSAVTEKRTPPGAPFPFWLPPFEAFCRPRCFPVEPGPLCKNPETMRLFKSLLASNQGQSKVFTLDQALGYLSALWLCNFTTVP